MATISRQKLNDLRRLLLDLEREEAFLKILQQQDPKRTKPVFVQIGDGMFVEHDELIAAVQARIDRTLKELENIGVTLTRELHSVKEVRS